MTVHIVTSRETGAFEFENVNYSGHKFSDFYVAQDRSRGPGWYVYGRNSEKYGTLRSGQGAYTMLCARPNVPARKHPHYNNKVKRGWRTMREAQKVADFLNHPKADFITAA